MNLDRETGSYDASLTLFSARNLAGTTTTLRDSPQSVPQISAISATEILAPSCCISITMSMELSLCCRWEICPYTSSR